MVLVVVAGEEAGGPLRARRVAASCGVGGAVAMGLPTLARARHPVLGAPGPRAAAGPGARGRGRVAPAG
jgi:hypothetical protein